MKLSPVDEMLARSVAVGILGVPLQRYGVPLALFPLHSV